ncbi:unnamed protein product [Ixodes pacificus]
MKGDEDSESVSLVGRDAPGSYTEDPRPTASLRETDYVDTDVPLQSQFHEDAVAQAGEGLFQWLVFLVCGLGLAADSIEVMVIAYVLPSAERELCMDDSRKGWLGGVSFVGMMIGGLVRTEGSEGGTLLREANLVTLVCTNSNAQCTRLVFFFFLRCSVGGSIPIVFTYYSEFLLKKHRGRNLCWLLLFWAIGGVFVSVTAWGLIPRTGTTLLGLGRLHFSSWRVFLLVCSLPSIVSVVGLAFLPESPRFLLEMGRDVEAMYVYQQIFKMNHSNKSGVDYQLSELELPGRRAFHGIPPAVNRTLLSDFCFSLESFWSSFFQMMCPPFAKVTMIMLVIWLTTSFGFYGMSIWFPEYLRKLQSESYSSETAVEANHYIRNYIFNYSIENTNFESCVFHNVRFTGIVLNHVLFTNCSFINSRYKTINSGEIGSIVRQKKISHSFIYFTALSKTPSTCSRQQLSKRCTKLTQFPYLPNIPYILIHLLFLTKMVTTCLYSSISTVYVHSGLYFVHAPWRCFTPKRNSRIDTETCNNIDCTLEFNLSTAYGFLSAASRLAALLGSLTFGHFISLNKSVPIITTSAVLLLGCLVSWRMPETKDVLM